MKRSKKTLILGSKSPRRAALLQGAGYRFTIETRPIKETYPAKLDAFQVAAHISRKKAEEFFSDIENKVVITADTTVILNNEILGKPRDEFEAAFMLKILSGKSHQVVTAVSLCHREDIETFQDQTTVTFRQLTEEEINHYISRYKPFDKAGAYGIQEWLGMIGVTSVSGSYFTVVGLPVHLVYERLHTLL